MLRWTAIATILASLVVTAGTARALDDHGTAAQAQALVQRAIAFLNDVGPDRAFAAFDDPHGKFVNGDLYIFVRAMDGNTVAHGANTAMIGHTGLGLTDADGKFYNREMIEIAKTKGSGWVDYRWVNPIDHKIEQKSSYIERAGDFVVGAGYYK